MTSSANAARLVDAQDHELGVFTLATPCGVQWSAMKGDDRVRRCGQCNLDVTDISQLTTAEAKRLLERVRCGDRVCARYFRRFDGTVLTQDCEGGLRAAWREAKRRRAHSNVLAAFGYLGIVAVTLWLTLTMFGDDIRHAFGMYAGGLAGVDVAERAPQPPTPRHVDVFGRGDPY